MSLTDCLVEVAWGDLTDDGAPPRAFGEALRSRSAVLVRDCPAQLATPPSLLYDLAEQLFGLPQDVLFSHAVDDLKNEGGFIPPGRWRGTVLPEVWHIVSEAKPPIRKARPASVWPSELPHLRSILAPYFDQLSAAADVALSAIARFYGRPPNYFEGLRSGTDDVLRLLHYRARPGQPPQGFAKHADLCLITLFPAATDPGLELEVGPDTWYPVEIPVDGVLIGTGGVLGAMTDGDMAALEHRVRELSASGVTRRYSASLFVNPRSDVEAPLLREPSGDPDESNGRPPAFESWFQDRIRKALEDGND